MRLNKYLALVLTISRRKADALVEEKKVRVNGRVAEAGVLVRSAAGEVRGNTKDNLLDNGSNNKDSDKARMTEDILSVGMQDKVEVLRGGMWQEVQSALLQVRSKVVLFCKPTKCTTARVRVNVQKTVYDFLPSEYRTLKVAGSLDFLSEGLLVLSNDGELVNKLTHQSFAVEKTYLVSVENQLNTEALERLRRGIYKNGYKTSGAKAHLLSEEEFTQWDFVRLDRGREWYIVTLVEGKNNEMRRLFGTLNHPVKRLLRIKHGEFSLTADIVNNGYIEVSR
jgi:pseudouridine synthase